MGFGDWFRFSAEGVLIVVTIIVRLFFFSFDACRWRFDEDSYTGLKNEELVKAVFVRCRYHYTTETRAPMHFLLLYCVVFFCFVFSLMSFVHHSFAYHKVYHEVTSI